MQTTLVNTPAEGADEAALSRRRLEALAAYGLLDGEPDPALDDLVEVAATLCETPIAAVNLLGEHQQLFKAERGLGIATMPLALSFCQPGMPPRRPGRSSISARIPASPTIRW